MASVKIRAGEVDLAISLMREVAQWCIDAGLPMWTLEQLTRESLLYDPPREEDFRVVYVDGNPAAALILQWRDPKFWPDVSDRSSGFIHKLCVRRTFAGIGLSARIVDAAVCECRGRKAGSRLFAPSANEEITGGVHRKLTHRVALGCSIFS